MFGVSESNEVNYGTIAVGSIPVFSPQRRWKILPTAMDAPEVGNWVLKCIDGVVQWVEDIEPTVTITRNQ